MDTAETQNHPNHCDPDMAIIVGVGTFLITSTLMLMMFSFLTPEDTTTINEMSNLDAILALMLLAIMLVICAMGGLIPHFVFRPLWRLCAPDDLREKWHLLLPIAWIFVVAMSSAGIAQTFDWFQP